MFQFINISASLRLSSGTKHFRSTYFKYPHLIDYNLAAIAFWPSVVIILIYSTLHQTVVYLRSHVMSKLSLAETFTF